MWHDRPVTDSLKSFRGTARMFTSFLIIAVPIVVAAVLMNLEEVHKNIGDFSIRSTDQGTLPDSNAGTTEFELEEAVDESLAIWIVLMFVAAVIFLPLFAASLFFGILRIVKQIMNTECIVTSHQALVIDWHLGRRVRSIPLDSMSQVKVQGDSGAVTCLSDSVYWWHRLPNGMPAVGTLFASLRFPNHVAELLQQGTESTAGVDSTDVQESLLQVSEVFRPSHSIVWSSRAGVKTRFDWYDLALSLLGLVLIILPTSLATWADGTRDPHREGYGAVSQGLVHFLTAVAVVSVPVGVFMFLGRFLVQEWRLRNTWYGLTATKAIKVERCLGRRSTIESLKSLKVRGSLMIEHGAYGSTGTLYQPTAGWYGCEHPKLFRKTLFENIEHPELVRDCIDELVREGRSGDICLQLSGRQR